MDCGFELMDWTLDRILDSGETNWKLYLIYNIFYYLPIIYSVLILLWLHTARARVVLFLVFSCYFPFTNTVSTDKTYSTAGSKGGIVSSKRKYCKHVCWLFEFFGCLMLGDDAQLYLH